jgi:hypothetical protein
MKSYISGTCSPLPRGFAAPSRGPRSQFLNGARRRNPRAGCPNSSLCPGLPRLCAPSAARGPDYGDTHPSQTTRVCDSRAAPIWCWSPDVAACRTPSFRSSAVPSPSSRTYRGSLAPGICTFSGGFARPRDKVSSIREHSHRRARADTSQKVEFSYSAASAATTSRAFRQRAAASIEMMRLRPISISSGPRPSFLSS